MKWSTFNISIVKLIPELKKIVIVALTIFIDNSITAEWCRARLYCSTNMILTVKFKNVSMCIWYRVLVILIAGVGTEHLVYYFYHCGKQCTCCCLVFPKILKTLITIKGTFWNYTKYVWEIISHVRIRHHLELNRIPFPRYGYFLEL